MSIVSFLRSKVFFKNLAILLGIILLIFGAVTYWLSSYTHHGESISVPDLRGQKIERLKTFLADKNLDFKVNDSLFVLDQPPGTVLEQDPAPGSKVKEGRTIYLTVNALHPPDVKMPDLADVSLRQAEAILQSFGLRVGRLSYKPDLAKNAVLEQLYKGSVARPGKSIPKGSAIDLVLGDGVGSVEVPVPSLIGQTYGEALFVLKGSSLNIGMVQFDAGVRDSSKAIIYKQQPEPSENGTINQGEAIDIYLR